jgi:hypothetical protein
MSNPWVREAYGPVLQAMLNQQIRQSDPMYQLELERAQFELERMRSPQSEPLPASVREAQWRAEQAGLVPGTPEFQDFILNGGGSGVTVNNNLGESQGRYLYGSDAGLPSGWRLDTETGEASRIPGGPDDLEAQEAEAASERTEEQGELMLGTTLQSINLNLAEIENGGLPVTGAIGDFRRTNLGRTLTGSGAVDFGNRNSQITDSAALAEIQRMRDNSPTGGAVGQLTDSERVAIGNAVTALNASTSADEYRRAATEYRNLALDLAYGEGQWLLGEDGSVVRADAAPEAPTQPAPPQQSAAPTSSGTNAGTLPQVSSQSEYDALLPGSIYRDPEGNVRQKPGGPTQ